MSTKSASSMIYDYLKTLAPEAEFTAVMIQEALGVSGGSVSGFLSKAVASGGIRVTEASGRSRVYTVVDLSVVKVRRGAGVGGRPGRSLEGVTGAVKAANLLRQIADQVQGFHSDLASYSTAELLKELTRRERAAAASGVSSP